ncbi:hypothetical protein M2447_001903 [Ereboglobus sp. PH5-10]|uniref:DUF3160 domain-containing protein n=1 Tax=Ereboglobus sp. PH5-10 TaxID=2940629 RepID=UPI0024056D42|nr:DUF3160 domain-containing protein [Ereboglobus sp. PH5-10]MDF9827801.1 hypothetical protein [Ereboglobus sp. PH5-10]
MLRPTLIALAAAFALSPFASAQRDKLPVSELTPAQHEQLQRDKLIIGAKDYPQIFTPYIALGKSPQAIRFITSDAALAAYHALFEDSFRELELRRATRLRVDLEGLYNACKPFSSQKKKPVYPSTLIQHILGPAMVILGTPATTEYFSESLLPEINRQVALIRDAEVLECPPWLDYSKDDWLFEIDYRRCEPVSFYADDDALADYHRAVRWLQLVPMRATNDAELAAWANMVRVSNTWEWYNERGNPEFITSFTGLSIFAGPIADRTIIVNNSDIRSACHPSSDIVKNKVQPATLRLDRLREILLQDARQNPPRSAINDENRIEPQANHSPFSDIRFRVMPTHALPDAEIISSCLNDNIRPNGLTVAAFLGSAFAHERMPKIKDDPDGAEWAAWCKRARQITLSQGGEPRSLYADYIDVLRALNAPPVKEAPAFMGSLPWQRKTCQTQLASWAQIRHTYALQAKLSVMRITGVGDLRPPPPGFVEPNPAFWREYVRFVERTIALLEQHGVFTPFENENADTSESLEYEPGFSDGSERVQNRWNKLATLSRQLETILAKQLDEIELTKSERATLVQFGYTLANAMGYFHSSTEGKPRDNAPRWAEVAHDPNVDESLGVATGRARALFVLYPWRGRELLCTGAVLSYYEEWALTKRLTDKMWKEKLDGPYAPPPPDWLAPILAK